MSGKEGGLSASIRIEISPESFHDRVKNSGIFGKIGKAIRSFFVKVWEFCKEEPGRVTFPLKVGLALLLVSLLTLLREPYDVFGSNVIWAILTVAVVFEYTVGATFSKGFNRGLGSILAGVLAIIVAQVALSTGEVVQPIIIGFSIFIVGAVTSFMKLWPSLKEYEYGFRVVMFTFCLITISAYRLGNPLRTAMDRLYSISIGAAVTMVVSVSIFPNWAGEELHRQIVKNFECVADSLEECVKLYLEESILNHTLTSQPFMYDCAGEPAFKRYQATLNSSTKEESLANSAKWEPPHGRFRHFFYPWIQYVKVGAVLRHCGYEVMALHGCLHSEIQAPYALRRAFDRELREVSTQAAALVRELGKNVNDMKHCTSTSLLKGVCCAAERLERKIDAHSYLFLKITEKPPAESLLISRYCGNDIQSAVPESGPGNDPTRPSCAAAPLQDQESTKKQKQCRKLRSWPSLEADGLKVAANCEDPEDEVGGESSLSPLRALESPSALSLGTFASLLIEFVARLDHLVDVVEELGRLAKFKCQTPN